MNDEGGISCHLDFASDDMNNVYVVSITHLRFDRRHPLTREIEAYCKHRIKRLKKIQSWAASNVALGPSTGIRVIALYQPSFKAVRLGKQRWNTACM